MLRASLLVAPLALAACVIGYRGEAEVEATYPLDGIATARVELPASPMLVVGDAMAPGLELRGAWRSVGGTAEVARANARTARLAWEEDGGFARLFAVIPLAVRGQIDFEVEEIRVPPELDLELATELGDIEVVDVVGNVGVDVGSGHVDILGGTGGVAVRTGLGDIQVESKGNLDLRTRRGTVEVVQGGAGGNDVIVSAVGDVTVVLRSDANLDLDLRGRQIRVQTRTVSTITGGAFRRTIGGGSVKIWLDAGPGSVEVRLAEDL